MNQTTFGILFNLFQWLLQISQKLFGHLHPVAQRYLQKPMHAVPSYLIAGYSKESRMRNFDPDTFELTFKDKSYKFLEAVNAVRKLLEASNNAASRVTGSV